MTRFSTILLAATLSLTSMASAAFAGGAATVYDFADRYPDAKVSNAQSANVQKKKSGDVERKSIFLHPTGSGDTIAEYSVPLPKLESGEKLVMVYSAGLSDGIRKDDATHPFDGVAFELRISSKKEFEANLKDTGWIDRAADLSSQAGKTIKIAFITRANKNTNYDWAVWGAPQILRLPKDAFSTGTVPIAKGVAFVKPSKDGVLTITPLDKSGNANGKPISISLKKGDCTASKFDFISSGVQSVKVDYSGNSKEIGVYGFSPSLQIAAFGPTNAIVYKGKSATLRAVIRNIGEGTLNESDAASAKFCQGATSGDGKPIMLGDPAMVGISTLPIGTLLPGESKTVECKFTPAANAAEILVGAIAILNGSSAAAASRSVPIAIVPADAGKAVTTVEVKQLADGSVVLQNAKLRMQFLKSSEGYAAWTMSVPKGNGWEQVSSGPFGKLVAGTGRSDAAEYSLYPSEAKTAGDTASFLLKKQIGTSPCAFQWTFKLDAEKPRVSVTHSVRADQPVDILHFSGPTVYAGEGSFAGKKDEGLFPGLEYLLTEQSSGTEFVYPPDNLRTVPHPNKITIPFMAIRSGGTLVMMEWDPKQRWGFKADRPAAVFASPNFIDGQDNHLMGIFAPSVPDWTSENALVAEKPFNLAAGKFIQIEAALTARTDSTTVLDAVDEWIARHSLPEPPVIAKKPHEQMDLCDQSFLGSAWDPTAKSWKHTITGPVFFDPIIANFMWARDNRIYDEERSQKIADVVKTATREVNDTMPLSTSLYAGNVKSALDRAYQQAEQLIKSQREDGSWPYQPDKEHEVFGKPGDTSSGWTALRAETLLEHALMTGDPKAKAAGLKALKFLDTATRPEGAQTWELQLHVPDILASAHLVRSYLAGYRLTDEKHYLDRAVYWAKSGLPFVYLWNADDQQIMRYGTIPVFGSTWFDRQPWFGVIVQWCGLEYGYALDKLSDFDKSVPWKQISKGILNCGIQQQEYTTREYPADAGMFPDAYSPIKGKEQYHWDINPRFIARNILRDLGLDSELTTHSVRDRRSQLLTMTLPVQSMKMVYENEWINVDFTYGIGSTIYAIIGGIYHPETFDLNGQVVRLVEDITQVDQGWQWDEERMVAILKLKVAPQNHLVIDLIQHEMRRLPEEVQAQPAQGESAKPAEEKK